MGCDYYRDTYLFVYYTNKLTVDDVTTVRSNFKHTYYDKFDIDEDCILKIKMEYDIVYCYCSKYVDRLLDDQSHDCSCVINSKEVLTTDKYSKLYSSLYIENNPIINIQRVIETSHRY